jgi:hypothetical protein
MGKCYLYGNGGVPSTGSPKFTYTGDYLLVNDGEQNWRLKLLTSGTLTFTNLANARDGIDVFLVGGGGGTAGTNTNGGSGGGYTKTTNNITLEKNKQYEIVIGAGGNGTDGGVTTAFGITADGGKGATSSYGAPGGSGGGAGWSGDEDGGDGGSDGNDGERGSYYSGGAGQGSTTREFGEETGELYSGGGGGSSGADTVHNGGEGGGGDTNKNGTPNTGGGGGAAANSIATSGGSGIVIIRNKR